jgi:hypothetical protein
MNGKWVANTLDAVAAVTVDRPWSIGASASADGAYPSEWHLDGLIDDVRIYDVPPSEYDVKTLF